MITRGFVQDSFTRHLTRVVLYHGKQEIRHPCNGPISNNSNSGGKKIILCMVPTEEELREQLKSTGGLNKHYAAVTEREAENFTNLLPGPQPPVTNGEEKPFLIIWSHFMSSPSRNRKEFLGIKKLLSRNRKAVSRSEVFENNIVGSKKVRCDYRGGRTETGMIRLCTECQRVSKLSSDRFPRYINEVACDEEIASRKKDNLCCNMHQGMCIQRYILIDFLVRTEKYVEVESPNPQLYFRAFKQVWEPYTQKIRSCCEFQLW
ncbi:uncharacterized protein LOC111335392 [Stylophora pistillata]|uniref:uncharacterized protein LOC111335392 n=1 Tax=Stylophora pistillata TaxID=50429 RepID=UPI000C04DEB2|nr:uncharacterized protein LOC111335392 [Stylophora pistillata]